MWALFLVAFFSFLRKSNLVVDSPSVTSDKLPCHRDFVLTPEGAFLQITLIPAELIKFQGDWCSDAYLVYLEMSSTQKLLAVNFMASRIT